MHDTVSRIDHAIVIALVAWYRANGRRLGIRRLRDGYAIWIGETMSQQTQIRRVDEALPGFLERFPDIATLAAASPADVVRAWGGLGYPRRALALRDAAREVVARFEGRLPQDVPALRSLPGVGPYTARAIAATAFGVPVTALDVNARRVLGRALMGHPLPATVRDDTQAAMDHLAPRDDAADWNHALMDLGALVCRPVPDCDVCPLRAVCQAADEALAASDHTTCPPRVRRRPAGPPFVATNRYVRGRILACLREAPPDVWTVLDPGHLGVHPDRLARALEELAAEGFVDRDGAGHARLREA